MNRTRLPRRSALPRGFTLIEMLVVVVIIGILAAILIPAVYMAINSAKNAALKSELTTLAQAIEAYRNKYGDYPPDWSDTATVIRHYKRIFPRSVETPPASLTEAQALVFCLQGYSPDTLRPFSGTGKQGVFDFDQTRLVTDPGGGSGTYLVYRPRDLNMPYVYFDARTYANGNATYTATGTITPYKLPDGTYAQPKSYQLLGAGQDDNYGAGGRPIWTAVGAGTADSDNITNFNQASTIAGDLP